MKTLFLKLEVTDKFGCDDEKEIMNSIKGQRKVYNVRKLAIHRSNVPLYEIEDY